MNNLIFIDANLFLAFENSNDVNHARALDCWKEISSERYGEPVTSDYVINEVVGVTLRKFGKQRAVIFGSHILNTVFLLNIDNHMLRDAWGIFSKTRLELNLVDCTHIVASRTADARFMATFDKEFKKVDGIRTIGLRN